MHKCPRPELRAAIENKDRYLATPRVATHRRFRFVESTILPDSRLFVFARQDEYFFGTLQSSIHECWALRQAPPHGLGNDPTYSATMCFETFPLRWQPGKEDVNHPAHQRISEAAKDLNALCERWLNPPEWLEPIADRIDGAQKFEDVPAEARALVRQSAIMAAAAQDARLKKRTLTNLYNERPTWLKLAHEKLDRAVLAAYAATDPAGQWDESFAQVFTDTGPGQPLPANHTLIAQRAEVERQLLGNLLRLNLARSGKTERKR